MSLVATKGRPLYKASGRRVSREISAGNVCEPPRSRVSFYLVRVGKTQFGFSQKIFWLFPMRNRPPRAQSSPALPAPWYSQVSIHRDDVGGVHAHSRVHRASPDPLEVPRRATGLVHPHGRSPHRPPELLHDDSARVAQHHAPHASRRHPTTIASSDPTSSACTRSCGPAAGPRRTRATRARGPKPPDTTFSRSHSSTHHQSTRR